MKKYLPILGAIVIPLVAAAHAEDEVVGEPSTIGHQLSELLPFVHAQEGHWVAAVVSVALWLSLIYAIYSIAIKGKR